MSTIQRLGYAIVMVRDYTAMKQWYADSLGLELTSADDEGMWATFRFPGGDTEIALHSIPAMAQMPAAPKGPGVVPCIQVSDINTAVADLESKGVEFTKGIHEGAGGTFLLANFKDPEGNLLQIYQLGAGV